MIEYRSWLPEEALEGCVAERLLADMVGQWSAKWFARQNIRPLGPIARLPSLIAVADNAEWLVLDRDLAIAVPVASKLALAAMRLDAPADATPATDADRQVVADLSKICLDDLSRRLSRMFRLPDDGRWTQLDATTAPPIAGPRGCSLGIKPGTPLLRLVVSTDVLVGLVKSGLPMPLAPDRLQPLTSGLAGQSLTLSALLGKCSLTLADMAGLSPGDVLVFDSETGSPLSVVLDNIPKPVGQCSVRQDDTGLHLTLLEPLDR